MKIKAGAKRLHFLEQHRATLNRSKIFEREDFTSRAKLQQALIDNGMCESCATRTSDLCMHAAIRHRTKRLKLCGKFECENAFRFMMASAIVRTAGK